MSRVSKAIKNIKFSLFFYILYIVVQFFARKIFLEGLGDSFIGLTATLQSFLGFLNLAELGIGTAVGVTLYKPLFKKNYEELNNIIGLFGYLYRKIGLVLIASGIILSLFFPIIFEDVSISLGIIYYVFFSFLISSLLGYFYNYHLFLLEADQKSYVVASYFQSFNLIKIAIQCVVVFYLQSFFAWITLELIFSILYSFFLRKRIIKEYPWLWLNNDTGKAMFKKYPDIILKVKQISAHKFGNFVTTNTDQILIFIFISVESVAFFGNYQLIFGKLSSLTNTAFAGTGAGIGNLVAENNKASIKKVFWEMMALRFFIAGIMCITLFYVVEPFIGIWLGERYILDRNVFFLFLLNLFILQIRVPVDHFKDAYGLFADTWAPITQSIINLGFSLYFVQSLGMAGILLGTLVSFSLIILIWRPYYLFKHGFEISLWGYWKEFSKLILAFVLGVFLTNLIISNFPFNIASGFVGLVFYSLKVILIALVFYSTALFIVSPGFRDISNRVLKIFKLKK